MQGVVYSCSVYYVISPKGLTWYPQPIKMHIFWKMPKAIHTASSASFCHLDWVGERGSAQPKLLDWSIVFSLVKHVFRVRASVYWIFLSQIMPRCKTQSSTLHMVLACIQTLFYCSSRSFRKHRRVGSARSLLLGVVSPCFHHHPIF